MAIRFSKMTPAEPDWRQTIIDLKVTVEVDKVLFPVAQNEGVVTPQDAFHVTKFCGSRVSDVRAVLDRVLEANKEVGTPTDNQSPHDSVEMNLRRLSQFGCAQAAVVSYVVPGVYVVWSAYKYGKATKAEYRCAIWLCVLRSPDEITYLVGDRYKMSDVVSTFFRRQHIVRSAHAKAPLYYENSITFDGRTFMTNLVDDPYPEFVTPTASMVFQTMAYDEAEQLATADDVDEWLRQSADDRWPQASRRVMADVVEKYATARLAEAQKL